MLESDLTVWISFSNRDLKTFPTEVWCLSPEEICGTLKRYLFVCFQRQHWIKTLTNSTFQLFPKTAPLGSWSLEEYDGVVSQTLRRSRRKLSPQCLEGDQKQAWWEVAGDGNRQGSPNARCRRWETSRMVAVTKQLRIWEWLWDSGGQRLEGPWQGGELVKNSRGLKEAVSINLVPLEKAIYQGLKKNLGNVISN